MKLSVSNTNISNNITTPVLSLNNYSIDGSIPAITNSTAIFAGIPISNVFVNTSTISVPSLTLGGVLFNPAGGTSGYGAIVNTQIFTANGTWTNPSANATLGLTGNAQVFIMMWGGGGGGWTDGVNWFGGGGSACYITTIPLSQCNTVCNVVVGTSGTGGNPATDGGNSIFYPNTSINFTVYGGAAATSLGSGSGGGLTGAGSGGYGTGGAPLGGAGSSAAGSDSTLGGGGAAGDGKGGSSIFGGGGGAWSGGAGRIGGSSVYGGGGGGSVAGSSVFGGNGGYDTSSTTVNGSIPGGGAAVSSDGVYPGNGGRGEVRIWVIK